MSTKEKLSGHPLGIALTWMALPNDKGSHQLNKWNSPYSDSVKTNAVGVVVAVMTGSDSWQLRRMTCYLWCRMVLMGAESKLQGPKSSLSHHHHSHPSKTVSYFNPVPMFGSFS